ncbi:MAG: hypothetical protein DDT32_01196 [Syntrophomonadaceae bacterium]|nr:hypothetical protein [Bacillota bacterium]MBT9147441.1 hypothetical protein [Bacillota bacterium]
MAHVRQVELVEIMQQLPDIQPLTVKREFLGKENTLFLCALGFEDRCLSIPELIAKEKGYKCTEAVYFEFATNVNDNEVNKHRLSQALQTFSTSVNPMPCDRDDFPTNLRKVLSRACAGGQIPSVIFDISVCSSKLLLLALKVLFECNLSLRILYSEAEVYHPRREEYESDPEKWTTEEGFGLARGVASVIPSAEHPGYRCDKLQEVVVVFPTFKPERAKAVIAEVDESLIMTPKDRIIWIVGEPHLPEDHWRVDAVREINNISDSATSYEVSTFYYKQTIERLERIYQPRDCKYHLTFSPLGSKMQSLGIALFWYMRRDVSIIFATPKEYNARQYSEGCKAFWEIDFGQLRNVRDLLDRVGQLQIVD